MRGDERERELCGPFFRDTIEMTEAMKTIYERFGILNRIPLVRNFLFNLRTISGGSIRSKEKKKKKKRMKKGKGQRTIVFASFSVRECTYAYTDIESRNHLSTRINSSQSGLLFPSSSLDKGRPWASGIVG